MGERDAFGREIGEDTLADMGWTGSPSPAPPSPAEPSPAVPRPEPPRTEPPPAWIAQSPAPAPPPPVASAPGPGPVPEWSQPAPLPRYHRRRRSGFSRLIFLMVVIVIIAASLGSLIKLGGDAVERGEDAIRGFVPETPTVAEPPDESESLLRPAALRKALDRLPAGRLKLVTLRPDALDVQITAGGKTTIVHVTAAGEVTSVNAPVSIPGKTVKVDPAVPARIVRTAARRSGRDPASVSHLVLTSAGGTAEWQLFFDDGLHYAASADGRKLRRV